MTREARLKATVAGLQPKGLDLTALAPARVASRVKSTPRVATDDAAYALGFSVADLILKDRDGNAELTAGAPLAATLLRLKYAEQFSLARFAWAHERLVHNYGGISGKVKRPDVTAIVAQAALVEWLKDTCPRCRGADAGAAQARRCPACAPKAPEHPWEVEGRPQVGCAKCGGLRRIFAAPKESRGLRCVPCNSTGRISYQYRRRFRLVNELVGDAAIARGEKPKSLRLDSFGYWEVKYLHFLDVLRMIDRQMGAGLDFGLHASKIRDIEPALEEKQDAATAEPSARQAAEESPEEPTGMMPPKES